MNGFKVKTPAKRAAHAHAADENHSGDLTFLNQHRGGKVDVDVQPSNGPLPGTYFANRPSTLWTEHWPKPKNQGYRYIVKVGGKSTRKLTKRELNKPIQSWSSAAYARLRTGPAVGSKHPQTLDTYVAHAKQVNCQPLPEIKNPNNAKRPKVARTYYDIFKRHNVALWPMMLTDGRGGIPQAVQEFGKLGVIVALIGGKHAQAKKKAMYRTAQSWKYKPRQW